MKEPARLERNQQRLTETYGPFGARMRGVLDTLEAQGFRPRIQDAHRSAADQMKAFLAKTSKLKFGFHNVTGKDGSLEALACDVLDDDHPTAPPTRYLLALAAAARAEGLTTGAFWGKSADVAGIEAAIASGNFDAKVQVGWDPTHVEPTGLTPQQAKNGQRPVFGAVTPGAAAAPKPAGPGGSVYVVKAGDTLGGIAKAHGITLKRLLELNPQFVPNPNRIKPGDSVLLP